jgi:DNA-binding transcriptional LysR family regulator
MDLFAAMQAFVRVAQLGSFSGAAKSLGVSQPSVSQQVAGLEAHLGARLIQRSTRRLVLTDAGTRYYDEAVGVLSLVARAEASVTRPDDHLGGRLRVQAPSGIGQRLLAPLLINFQAMHPQVRIELLLDDRIADVVAEGVDVALRLGVLPASGLIAHRLGGLRRVLVASPAYIALHGSPGNVFELSQHAHVRFAGSLNDDIVLGNAGGEVAVAVPASFVANNSFVLLDALLAGRGIGGTQEILAAEALADGRLLRVLPEYSYPSMDVHVVIPTRHHVPAAVKALVDLLQSEAVRWF